MTMLNETMDARLAIAALLALLGMLEGCGDDAGCPMGTVEIDGSCVAGTPDSGMGSDSGPPCTPTGDETCDGTDEDCDGRVDEGFELSSFFTDADGDGFGDADSPVEACTAGPGLADVGGDCDDGNGDVNPDATEVCNGLDDDCSGGVDEGLLRASEPVSTGVQGIAFFDTFFAYGSGYFVLYYDSLTEQAQYMLLDGDGGITAGPLRVADTPVRDFFLYAEPIDDERIAVGYPAEVSDGVFDFRVGVLNPGTPSETLDPVTVLADLDGIPSMKVVGDRIVALDEPASFAPDDQEGRLASVNFMLEDAAAETSVPRSGDGLSITGLVGSTPGYVVRSHDDGTFQVQPLDPTTLSLGAAVTSAVAPRVLGHPPPVAIAQEDDGALLAITFVDAIDADGNVTVGVTTMTGLRVPAAFGGITLTHSGENFTVMTCNDEVPDVGQCNYQFIRVGMEAPVSDVFTMVNPGAGAGDGYGLPHLTTRDGVIAGIVASGDLTDDTAVPDLQFFQFECPDP